MRFNPWLCLFVLLSLTAVAGVALFYLTGLEHPLVIGFVVGFILGKLGPIKDRAQKWKREHSELKFGSEYERMKHDYDVRHVSTWAFVRRESDPRAAGQDSYVVYTCSRHGEFNDLDETNVGCPMCSDLRLKGRFVSTSEIPERNRGVKPFNVYIHCDTHKSFNYDCLDCFDALVEHRNNPPATPKYSFTGDHDVGIGPDFKVYGKEDAVVSRDGRVFASELRYSSPHTENHQLEAYRSILDPEEREALLRRDQGSYPPDDKQ